MRRLAPITALVLAAALLGTGLARSELVQSGTLRLAFDGGFEPQILPRDRVAPVTVSFSGSLSSTSGGLPPQLRRISIAINRYGRLFTRGLPVCQSAQLEETSTQEALSRCSGALIGHGRFGVNIDLPSSALPVEGKILAFNSRAHGRPSILLHIYGWKPVQATFVLRFDVTHRRAGAFGTVISTSIPTIAADLGHVSDVSFTFGRRYRFAGQLQSFLSARCAAPAGFRGAFFPFAQGSFTFADGQRLTTTLARSCRVR